MQNRRFERREKIKIHTDHKTANYIKETQYMRSNMKTVRQKKTAKSQVEGTRVSTLATDPKLRRMRKLEMIDSGNEKEGD